MAVTVRVEALFPKSTPETRIQLPASPEIQVLPSAPSTVIPASRDMVAADTVRKGSRGFSWSRPFMVPFTCSGRPFSPKRIRSACGLR